MVDGDIQWKAVAAVVMDLGEYERMCGVVPWIKKLMQLYIYPFSVL